MPNTASLLRILGWFSFLAVLSLAVVITGYNPFSLIAGGQDLAVFAGRVFPPDFSEIDQILELSLESLGIAFLGTALALIAALPTAVIGASSVRANILLRLFSKTIVLISRAVPGLVFALLFVQIVGPGPTAGILALAANSIGMMAKLFSDAIDTLDQSAIRALTTLGATRQQVFFAAVLPQLFPALVATTLHRLDINFRYSAILGLVGAGGIGLYLQYNIIYFEYQDAMAAVLVIVAAVLLMELFSNLIRRYLMTPRASSPMASLKLVSITVAASILVVWVVNTMDIAWSRISTLPSGVADLASKMWPADFETYQSQLIEGTLESLSMALVATVFGAAMAVPLGFLGAKKIGRVHERSLARGLSQLVRGVPDLILALFLVSALGLGPATGTLVMTIGTLGFLTKFVADSVEELNYDAYFAIVASGATRLQATLGAIVPQARNIVVSHLFYALDINFRISALMGIVGAGGIGAAIMSAIEVNDFGTAFAALTIVFVCVAIIEGLSRIAVKK